MGGQFSGDVPAVYCWLSTVGLPTITGTGEKRIICRKYVEGKHWLLSLGKEGIKLFGIATKWVVNSVMTM